MTSSSTTLPPTRKGYIITGRAAHERISRLFSNLLHQSNDDGTTKWVDLSPYAKRDQTTSTAAATTTGQAEEESETSVAFLWENSTRSNTKPIRDTVQVYSHLPYGTAILDDKWVLARLLGDASTVPHARHVHDDDIATNGGSAVDYGENNDAEEGKAAPNKELKCTQQQHEQHLATLESHCFRGSDFCTFVKRVGLLPKNDAGDNVASQCSLSSNIDDTEERRYQFEDLMRPFDANASDQTTAEPITNVVPPPTPSNLWVIKDAMSNGAGGIWIVDPSNISEFLDFDDDQEQYNTSILHPTHRYIAQRYAWPPTLHRGRKCHVRVYGCINSKGEAYVHKRAFLHVANDTFEYIQDTNIAGGRQRFESSVHITNCCANSHDVGKFAGEICADLTKTCGLDDVAGETEDVPLGKYFPSISASVAALAQRSAPFLRGGQANNGFEYLGMDFVLSSVPQSTSDRSKRVPVAYLLEVNAPPSQDTATGLTHAETLHDEVITDLLRMCVLPELGIASRECGGWICVHKPEKDEDSRDTNQAVVPSKAAFVNRVRWALFERKAAKQYERSWCQLNRRPSGNKCESSTHSLDHDAFVRFIRSQFPYFSPSHERRAGTVFLESGGGAQVPQVVMDAVVASMSNRDRSVLGADCQQKARRALLSLLTGREAESYVDSSHQNIVIMGPNATSLLEDLAQRCFEGILKEGDEIVIASENHFANVLPWVTLAKKVGARVKWWTVTDTKKDFCNDSTLQHVTESSVLSELVTSKTKLVAVSHASNILGCVRLIPSICRLVHHKTKNQGHVVVDGVAAAPHMLSLDVFHMTDPSTSPDFYVVSLHKLFGPHMGCLIAKKSSLLKLLNSSCKSDVSLYKSLERGTMNYEACAAACALKKYFHIIANESKKLMSFGSEEFPNEKGLTRESRLMHQTVNSLECPSSPIHENTKCYVHFMQTATIAIQNLEARLVNRLLHRLHQSSPLVRIIQDPGHQQVGYQVNLPVDKQAIFRLPIVCFVHSNILSSRIVEHCRSHGVVCRACTFLSTDRFWKEMGIGDSDVVRFSMAHYNTTDDVDRAVEVLEMIDDWD
ncbi:hypothetical protein ACHAWX_006995, partial [Stephanocyclus meneghinianus]